MTGEARWGHAEAVEYATLEWVGGFDHRRLFAPIGYLPQVEYEQQYYRRQDTLVLAAGVNP